MNQRGGVMNMRLDPPELGQMRVQMTIAGGAVSAVFQAMDPGVQQLLERNLASLRMSLESQGLQVDKLSVQSSAAQSSASGNAQNQQQQDAQQQSSQQAADQRGQSDAGEGQSRGRSDDAGSSNEQGRSSQGQQDAGEAMNAFQRALHELEESTEDDAAGAVAQGVLQ